MAVLDPRHISNAAVQNAFQCRLAKVCLIRAILSSDSQSPRWPPVGRVIPLNGQILR
jgi:hypothetical protein